VRLTPEGRAHALGVVAPSTGLIETFLVHVLKMDWKDVHEEAEAPRGMPFRTGSWCESTPSSATRPRTPHGDPIPTPKCPLFDRGTGITLATCAPQKPFRVERILDQSTPFLEVHSSAPASSRVPVGCGSATARAGSCVADWEGGETTLGLPEAAKIEVKAA